MGEEVSGSLEQRVRAWLTAGEDYYTEFKSDRKKLNDRDLVETVVCLANGHGGVLLIGAEDDGRVTGAQPRNEAGRTDPLRLQAMIANNTQPPVTTTVNIVVLDECDLIAVEVPRSAQVVGTTQGTYVRRALGGDGQPMCVPYFAHQMLAREIDRSATDFARLPAPEATWGDLDPLEFERVRRFVGESSGGADQILASLSDREVARALGVGGDEDEVKIGALLLFGRPDALKRFVPTHEAAFQVLRGLDVESNDILTYPLFRLADEMFSRFRARNSEEEVQFGLFRLAVPAYSETAYREALANALTHRDYTQWGVVQVQWTEDNLRIASPGGLPEGIRLENFLVASPHPRSPTLADAFKRTGLVERTGRGINRMFAEQLRVGRPAPDYGQTTEQQVIALLPGGPANLAMTRWVYEQDQEHQLSLLELQVLSELLTERRATTGDLARLTQQTETQVRMRLGRMVEQGWIEARGERKGRTWHLSASVYRALESSAGYVRVRGFDLLQQEQMVLSFIDAHGRITRGQTAELCAIAPEQATRLLRKLVKQGQLIRHGERKGSFYQRLAGTVDTASSSHFDSSSDGPPE